MSAMLSGLPTSDTSQCLQGSDIATQTAISAGQYRCPIDALGAYKISVDPQLVCGSQHWKKTLSVTTLLVYRQQVPSHPTFFVLLAFRRAGSGFRERQPHCSPPHAHSSACGPFGSGAKGVHRSDAGCCEPDSQSLIY